MLRSLRTTWRAARLPFDRDHYLASNPDVRAAGVNPYLHFLRFGFGEGRAPHALQVPELEPRLWTGEEEAVLPVLRALALRGRGLERPMAALALARWYVAEAEFEAGHAAMCQFFRSAYHRDLIRHPAPYLLAMAAAAGCGVAETGDRALRAGVVRFGCMADFELGELALDLARGHSDAQLAARLNAMWQARGLSGVSLRPGPEARFDRLHAWSAPPAASGQSPRVSVIVPVHNGGQKLRTALRSLLAQTYRDLEIIVVDDASTDGTSDHVQSLAARESRVRILQSGARSGAYVARNRGLAAARGAFLTLHDADDWSHPAKIARQVQWMMSNPQAAACMCHWVRMTPELVVTRWRIDRGWLHGSMSSMMIRREVFETLGFFDRVRVAGDKEYLLRIEARYGAAAIGLCAGDVPLAFGRMHAGSLTQTAETHIRTHLKGPRRDYELAARDWHGQGGLYLPQFPTQRPFPVPDALRLPETDQAGESPGPTSDPKVA